MGSAGVPRDPDHPSLQEGVERFQLAMYKANDCLRRCADAIDCGDAPNINTEYADRQAMLAAQAVEELRVSLELIRRAISVKLMHDQASRLPHPAANLFPAAANGPYERGA